ncbi:hypothetical protein HOLleu_26367 [Holothuria leucospilota]|uniref:Uncharacterized protein n=1 Tax=Holothuria leucospilota TaxID=206669 RepID=A0A9Q1BT72_HOLLE|nr:hypothetical protein HOLleu_26367 [Holothuria leucospilota]
MRGPLKPTKRCSWWQQHQPEKKYYMPFQFKKVSSIHSSRDPSSSGSFLLG